MNMNSMKKQKYMTSQNKSPKLEGIQYATGEEQRAITNSSRKNKSRNNAQLWICLLVKVKPDALKNNIA